MRERCVPILSDVSLFASIPRLPRVRTVPETCLAGARRHDPLQHGQRIRLCTSHGEHATLGHDSRRIHHAYPH